MLNPISIDIAESIALFYFPHIKKKHRFSTASRESSTKFSDLKLRYPLFITVSLSCPALVGDY